MSNYLTWKDFQDYSLYWQQYFLKTWFVSLFFTGSNSIKAGLRKKTQAARVPKDQEKPTQRQILLKSQAYSVWASVNVSITQTAGEPLLDWWGLIISREPKQTQFDAEPEAKTLDKCTVNADELVIVSCYHLIIWDPTLSAHPCCYIECDCCQLQLTTST